MSTLTAPKAFVETSFKVVYTGLDGDGDQVHAEEPCDGRVLAELTLDRIEEWQYDNELPADAHIQTRRGFGPWGLLSVPAEQIEVHA